MNTKCRFWEALLELYWNVVCFCFTHKDTENLPDIPSLQIIYNLAFGLPYTTRLTCMPCVSLAFYDLLIDRQTLQWSVEAKALILYTYVLEEGGFSLKDLHQEIVLIPLLQHSNQSNSNLKQDIKSCSLIRACTFASQKLCFTIIICIIMYLWMPRKINTPKRIMTSEVSVVS